MRFNAKLDLEELDEARRMLPRPALYPKLWEVRFDLPTLLIVTGVILVGMTLFHREWVFALSSFAITAAGGTLYARYRRSARPRSADLDEQNQHRPEWYEIAEEGLVIGDADGWSITTPWTRAETFIVGERILRLKLKDKKGPILIMPISHLLPEDRAAVLESLRQAMARTTS